MTNFLNGRGLAVCAAALISAITVASCGAPARTDSLSGSQLWEARCGQCHNFRVAAEFDDAQWDTVMAHMRVTANLAGAEARAIADYLRSTND